MARLYDFFGHKKMALSRQPLDLGKLDRDFAAATAWTHVPAEDPWAKRRRVLAALASVFGWNENAPVAFEVLFDDIKHLDDTVFKWLIILSRGVEHHKLNSYDPPYIEEPGEGFGGAFETLASAAIDDGLIQTWDNLYDLRKWLREMESHSELRARLQV